MQYDKRRLLAALAVLAAGGAAAHGERRHADAAGSVKNEQKDWGIAGDPTAVRRTVECEMADTMRFEPARIDVRQGETVRFRVRNNGRTMHEFVIGTRAENAAHAALMKKFPNMEHDEPYMAHVPPGRTREIVWTFNRAGEFEFACLIPGHYDAGMSGVISVRTA